MTDNYPDEEGHIADGLIIGFCRASATITAGYAVSINSSVDSGYVYVTQGAADGDSVGVALKAASAQHDIVPVCFYGVVKMYGYGAITAGFPVMNDATANRVIGLKADTSTWATALYRWAGLDGGGTLMRLGIALQPCATTNDELLVLVGGLR